MARRYFTVGAAKRLIIQMPSALSDGRLQRHIVKLRDFERYINCPELYGDILVNGGYFARLADPSGAWGLVPTDLWLRHNISYALDIAYEEQATRNSLTPRIDAEK